VHLCVHCAAAIVRNAERNLMLAARGYTKPMACPVCGKRFANVRDIVTNVERL
jgi:primosomal protein N'